MDHPRQPPVTPHRPHNHQPGLSLAGPLAGRIVPGLVLITVVGLLAAAAFGTSYRLATRAAAAGCIGTALLDMVMITGVALAIPSVTWVATGAMAASAVRIAFSARALHPVLAS